MIINTEIREIVDSNLQPVKQLVISYIGEDRQTKFLSLNLPQEQLYEWHYARRGDTPDPYYRSWDFKGVVKAPISGKFTEQRIHEIMLDVISTYPEAAVINDMHVPDTAFCDIEVDVGDDGFPTAEAAKNPVNTISWVHDSDIVVLGRADLSESDVEMIQRMTDEHCARFETKYKFTYVYHANEIDLLMDFFQNYFMKVCAVTGWNWFGYDWPYLKNRCKLLNINLDFLSPTGKWTNYKTMMASTVEEKDEFGNVVLDKKGNAKKQFKGLVEIPMHKCMYDYEEIYKKWDQSIRPKISNKLDWVAEKVLGVKKVVHSLGFKEFWEQKPAEYVFYNGIDSVLVKEIDNVLKTSSVFFILANLMHTPALTAFNSTKSIEIVQAEYLYREQKVFPVVPKKSMDDKEGYEGAFVFQPTPGVYHNILTLDYASLYPTTMRQFNISPDTFKFKNKMHTAAPNEIKCSNGSVYTKDFEGFIPKILTDFYGKRKEYKKEMQIAEREKYYLIEVLERRRREAGLA